MHRGKAKSLGITRDGHLNCLADPYYYPSLSDDVNKHPSSVLAWVLEPQTRHVAIMCIGTYHTPSLPIRLHAICSSAKDIRLVGPLRPLLTCFTLHSLGKKDGSNTTKLGMYKYSETIEQIDCPSGSPGTNAESPCRVILNIILEYPSSP